MSNRAAKLEALRAKGCVCGLGDRCPVHSEPSDNRGLRAWFEAGMPLGFPMEATCSVCGAAGLLYPNVEIDDPNRSGEYHPTLICPCCSKPPSERALREDAEQFGYELRPVSVFGSSPVAA